MSARALSVSICLMFTSVCHGADGTDIGTLAESMEPGSWAELQTTGLQVMNAPEGGGASGHILAYAHEFIWDPNSRKAFFVGGDHDGGPEKFVEYSAVNNAWSENSRPGWMSGSNNQNHSYSYMGWDPRGRFWYGNKEYDTASETWADHGWSGQHTSSSTRARRAHAYLAGVGSICFFEGAVYVWDEDGSGPWRTVRSRFSLGTDRDNLHFVAIENPVTNKVLMGGGESGDQLWLMDASENITALGPTPFSQVSNKGNSTSVITVDPGTGFFIVHAPSGELWEFDSENDRWARISQSTPLSNPTKSGWQNAIIGATSTTYNVSIYVRWILGATPKMWLYKHSPTPPVKRSKPLEGLKTE